MALCLFAWLLGGEAEHSSQRRDHLQVEMLQEMHAVNCSMGEHSEDRDPCGLLCA